MYQINTSVQQMKRSVHARVDSDLLGKFEKIAKDEKRSINNMIEKVLEDFVDNAECDKRKNEKRVSVEVGNL